MYPMMFPMLIPNLFPLKNDYDEPPTIYSILNSIVNFDNPDPVKIKDLANAGRSRIFDFDYDLSNNITKEKFECMILNHYMMRRIGYETVTAFKLALNVRLNEIMPYYNKLFDAMANWKIFEDGETTHRDITTSNSGSDTSDGTASSNGSANDSTSSDRRYSNTPQNKISEVRSGEYVTEYNYDQNTGTSSNTNSSTSHTTATNSNNGETHETVTHTPADKMKNYIEYANENKKIFSMIFKDLDQLFYQLI